MTRQEYEEELLKITPEEPLMTVNGIEVCERRFKRQEYLIEGLLRPGLTVLAGSPKIGKSWLTLQMCLQVAKGEPFWGLQTRYSEVLYLALEDSQQRLQRRMLTLTGEPPAELHFALSCSPLDGELEKQISYFAVNRPLTRLVAIDTFQMVRSPVRQMSYANDYSEVSRLKSLADSLGICILLVHHTRKMGDSDRFNEISGTNGISGSADTLMVLSKEKRTDKKALLCCTGRDIEDMELELMMDKNSCRFKCTSPIEPMFGRALPQILKQLLDFMKVEKHFSGTNREFVGAFSSFIDEDVNMSQLSRKMSYFRYELEDRGLRFELSRTKAERCIKLDYNED